jgi:hypothetical protein
MPFDRQPEETPAPLPLRVGLLVDNFSQPRWIPKIIADVQASEIARFVVVVRNTVQPEKTPRLQSLWKRRHQLLYVLFDSFERRWFRSEPCAFDLYDVAPRLAGIPLSDAPPSARASVTTSLPPIWRRSLNFIRTSYFVLALVSSVDRF